MAGISAGATRLDLMTLLLVSWDDSSGLLADLPIKTSPEEGHKLQLIHNWLGSSDDIDNTPEGNTSSHNIYLALTVFKLGSVIASLK